MRKLLVLALFAVFATLANADTIPTFNMTIGTVTLTNIGLGGSTDTFSFSNGNGVSLGGVDDFPPVGMSPIGGGSTGNPFLLLGLNMETSNVNGTTLFLFGSETITGADFTLPTSGSIFSTTL